MYHIEAGFESFDGPVRHINAPILIHNNEQLKRKQEHFTTRLNRIISNADMPLMDDIARYRNMSTLQIKVKS